MELKDKSQIYRCAKSGLLIAPLVELKERTKRLLELSHMAVNCTASGIESEIDGLSFSDSDRLLIAPLVELKEKKRPLSVYSIRYC